MTIQNGVIVKDYCMWRSSGDRDTKDEDECLAEVVRETSQEHTSTDALELALGMPVLDLQV